MERVKVVHSRIQAGPSGYYDECKVVLDGDSKGGKCGEKEKVINANELETIS
jgi:hypothetical protein